MSKYSDDLTKNFKEVKALRKATKTILKKEGKLFGERFYTKKSLARLKKKIMETK